VVQECLLGQHHPLAQHKQLENCIFLAGQVHRLAVHRDLVAVEVQQQRTDAKRRLAEALAAPHDRLHASQQLRLVKRLGDEIIGSQTEAFHLDLWARQPGQDQHRGIISRDAHPAYDLETFDVGQHQVENHDVVVVVTGKFEAFLAGIGMIDHGANGPQHQ
jgi:hypothetical protein